MISARPKTTTHRLGRLVGIASAALVAIALAAPAAGAAAPRWQLESHAATSVPAGATLVYHLRLGNVGNASAVGSVQPLTLEGALPPGITVQSVTFSEEESFGWECPTLAPGSQQFKCSNSSFTMPALGGVANKSSHERLTVTTAVAPGLAGPTVLSSTFTLGGGGAVAPATLSDPTTITSVIPGFGVDGFDVQTATAQGERFGQSGGHPDSIVTYVQFNSAEKSDIARAVTWPVEPVKDAFVDLPPGLAGNVTRAAQCTFNELQAANGSASTPECPTASQLGLATANFGTPLGGDVVQVWGPVPVYNMVPGPGEPARFGFDVGGVPVTLGVSLRYRSDFGLTVSSAGISQALPFDGSVIEFWNDPSSPSHDNARDCPGVDPPWEGGPTCPGGAPGPILRMPTSCSGPLPFTVHADSWYHPGAMLADGTPDLSDPAWHSQSIVSHLAPGFPADPTSGWGEAQGVTGCTDVPVRANLTAQLTALEAETPSGLAVHVEVPNPGMEADEGIASSDIKAVKVALPRGVTINPSQAEGLGVCTVAQYESSELSFEPGGNRGCPSDSKIGTVEVHTPLLKETIPGNIYVAKPYDNPFGSLLAIYMVFEEPERGVLIKVPGRIETDPVTGQILTSFDNLPQLPFSSFDFHFREGARAPLVSPAVCGSYGTEAQFTPWSDPSRSLVSDSSFQVVDGIGGGACPSGGVPPFAPQVTSGTLNNNAGSYTQFDLHITRQDGEQELTRFSTTLPPGVTGNLTGIPFCPDAAIEAARTKTGEQEQAQPSCPAASEIGHTIVGAGVGSVLAHTPGKLYLAGPYHGSSLSLVSITSATVGPFDLGTVVIRFALRINPTTAQVEVDASGSDPIPHILQGIVVHVRDIRVYVDRPNFIRNPTSCDPMGIATTITGAGADFTNPADQDPVPISTRFQAANCSLLGFKPSFKASTSGKTSKLGGASLHVTLAYPNAPEGSQANIRLVRVSLPKQLPSRLTTLQKACLDSTFEANPAACPAASRVGVAKAITPILPVPLVGPAYFVSHGGAKFPELIVVLQGYGITIELHGETFISRRGITSSTFATVPDQPVTSFELTLPQGPNSALAANGNLCRAKLKMPTTFVAQNGATIKQTTAIIPTGCPRHAAKHHKHHKHRSAKTVSGGG